MARALIDVDIDNLTNEQVDEVLVAVKKLVTGKYPMAEVDLSVDTEYDPEDSEEV